MREEVRMIVDQETEVVLDRIMDSLDEKLSDLDGISIEFIKLRDRLKAIEMEGLKKLAERIDCHDKNTHPKVEKLLFDTTANQDDLKSVIHKMGKLNEVDQKVGKLLNEIDTLRSGLEQSLSTYDESRKSLTDAIGKNSIAFNEALDLVLQSHEELKGFIDRRRAKTAKEFHELIKRKVCSIVSKLEKSVSSIDETRIDVIRASNESTDSVNKSINGILEKTKVLFNSYSQNLTSIRENMESIKSELNESIEAIGSKVDEASRSYSKELASFERSLHETKSSIKETRNDVIRASNESTDSVKKSIDGNLEKTKDLFIPLSQHLTGIRVDMESNTAALNERIEAIDLKVDEASRTYSEEIASFETSLQETNQVLKQVSVDIKRNSAILEYMNRPWWKRLFGKGRP